ncbi:hypothetical protein CKO38_13540 [Rhodospirillum rubrum]|uniref:phage holin family protein n=1 Tax=Rhodospirillum rubrum TaxID=1085 RepID=UPI001906A3D9|nr:phage holin family protein [Rhodospirillum rubrum]MBK1665567.1 hypothetical protein [Rhodospirillum rubrum]MBK1677674.1 hypothetical protein [Rhodospirillum rubrum]
MRDASSSEGGTARQGAEPGSAPARGLSRLLNTLGAQVAGVATEALKSVGGDALAAARRSGQGVGWMAAALGLTILTLGFLGAGLAIWLREVLPAWAGFVAVGGGFGVLAMICALIGRHHFAEVRRAPQRTKDAAKRLMKDASAPPPVEPTKPSRFDRRT